MTLFLGKPHVGLINLQVCRRQLLLAAAAAAAVKVLLHCQHVHSKGQCVDKADEPSCTHTASSSGTSLRWI